MLDRRRQEPGSREHARKSRHQYAVDLEFLREGRRVNAAATAEWHQDEFTRVEAALYRHETDAVRHLRIHHAVDSERRLDEAEPKRFRDTLADRILREPAIELQRAPREIAWVKIAECQGGVGDRRLDAAGSITGGARLRTGRMRPDAQA